MEQAIPRGDGSNAKLFAAKQNELAVWAQIAGSGRRSLVAMLRALDPSGVSVPAVVANVLSAKSAGAVLPEARWVSVSDWDHVPLRSAASLQSLLGPRVRQLSVASAAVYQHGFGSALSAVLRGRRAAGVRVLRLEDPGGSGAEMGVEGAKSLGDCIRGMAQLKSIELCGLRLVSSEGGGPSALAALLDGVRQLRKLRSLQISCMTVSEADARVVGSAVADAGSIARLSMEGCGMQQAAVDAMMRELSSCSGLTSIDVDGNAAVPHGAALRYVTDMRVSPEPGLSSAAMPFLRSCPSLQCLRVVLQGADACAAAALSAVSPRLSSLCIRATDTLTPATISGLKLSLRQATSLRELRLNCPGSAVPTELLDAVRDLPLLTRADVQSRTCSVPRDPLFARLRSNERALSLRRREAVMLVYWLRRCAAEAVHGLRTPPLCADRLFIRDVVSWILPPLAPYRLDIEPPSELVAPAPMALDV